MQTPSRIMHISTASGWRGGERQIYLLAVHQEASGMHPIVLCPMGSPLAVILKESGITVIEVRRRSAWSLRGAADLARLTENFRPEIIHAHDSHGHTRLVLAGRFFGVRTPMIIHRRVDFPPSGVLSGWKYRYHGIGAVICVSECIRNVLAETVYKKHPEWMAKVYSVHSGIDISRFKRLQKGYLRKLSGIKKGFLIGNASALSDQKDPFTFLRVSQIVCALIPESYFVLMGEGHLREALNSEIKRLGLEDRVFLTGFIREVEQAIADLDILLITSRKEGLGTVVLDGMAAGTPVVATNTGGIPEIIVHGKNGLMAEAADAEALAGLVCQLIKRRSLRNKLRLEAKKTVLKFSARRMFIGVNSVYRNI